MARSELFQLNEIQAEMGSEERERASAEKNMCSMPTLKLTEAFV